MPSSHLLACAHASHARASFAHTALTLSACRCNLVGYANNHQPVPRELLVRAFADMLRSRVAAVDASTTFLDVRSATDPESRGYSQHCGEHPHIIHSVAQHACRQKWFAFLRRSLREVAERHGCKVEQNLVFVCRAGKHRSVAMAFLAHDVLRRTASYSPTLPVAAGVYWGSLCRCGGPTYCRACGDQDSPLRGMARTLASDDWTEETMMSR